MFVHVCVQQEWLNMADLTSFTFEEESKSHYRCYHYHSESPWNDAGTVMGLVE